MSRHSIAGRATFSAAILAVASLSLAACASPQAVAGSDDQEPVAGGILNLEYFPDNPSFQCIDPFQVYWLEHRTLIRNFADSLTDQDPETGEIVPWLATDWEVSDDAKSYTFNLRDDVTFSDGTPFNAEAVQIAFENNQQTAADVPGTFGASYFTGYDSTEVIDENTVRVNLTEPNGAFLQATSTTNLAILAPVSYTKTPQERCLGDVVGSGAFVLDSYVPNEKTTLSKRDGYAWGSSLGANQGEAYLDGINVSYVAEDSVRVGNVISGASDIAWPRNPFSEADIAQLEASGVTIESRALPGPANNYYPNVTDGRPLSDKLVRQAVNKALDRESYASTVYGDDYPVVEGAYNGTTPFFTSSADALAHDEKGAARLLDEAGWILNTDDGYRYKNGEKLTLSLGIQLETSGDVLIQDQLKQVGIDVVLDVFVAAERPAVIASGDYDLIGSYMTRADPGVLQTLLDVRFANSKGFAQNSQTPEEAAIVQGLFDQGLAGVTPDDRAKPYAELQSYLIEEGITFPIAERVQFAGTAPNVHGLRFTSESFLALNDVWLTPENG